MKRSQVNQAIDSARKVLDRIGFRIPGFAAWDPDAWKRMRPRIVDIVRTGMGWDVTDFGSGSFATVGATILTLRNGHVHDASLGVPYAEKVIILTPGQTIPLHHHHRKTEDIINRGGGLLCVRLHNSLPDGSLDRATGPRLKCDGIWETLEPGGVREVRPGDSVTLTPGLYHALWAKSGEGTLVCGEVSTVNDDNTDNRFL
jgi:D-lyxose ketol-isomerase